MSEAHALDVDTAQEPTETYLTAGQVRHRYGDISDMTLWRWLRDEKLGFPKPIEINRRRFWRLSRLKEFDQQQADRAPEETRDLMARHKRNPALAGAGLRGVDQAGWRDHRAQKLNRHARTRLKPALFPVPVRTLEANPGIASRC